jgi:predicted nuclease with RNAse H fold
VDWFGADPGGTRNGKPCFGVAWLGKNGTFETSATDCAHRAFRWIQKRSVVPLALGIDCPLWWSSLKGGERQVDVLLRRKYRDNIGQSVQSLNSLPGAVLVQGMMLACEARKHWKEVKITETHPRALLKAMHLDREPWSTVTGKFNLNGPERTIPIGAACCRRCRSTGRRPCPATVVGRAGDADRRQLRFIPLSSLRGRAAPGFGNRCRHREGRLGQSWPKPSLWLRPNSWLASGSRAPWPQGPAALIVQFRRHGGIARPGRRIRSLDVRVSSVSCELGANILVL